MQYAIISVINGNYKVEVETNDEQQVYVNFHQKCASLWNAEDVTLAYVAIVDQQLNKIRTETIQHIPTPEPEPVEE